MIESSFSAEDFWSKELDDGDEPSGEGPCACPSHQPPRRLTWMDDELRPRVFTPPPSRSAVQAHRTTADGVGHPLPPRVQARMERALGGDLSRARVHIQSAAAEDERAIAVTQVLARLLGG